MWEQEALNQSAQTLVAAPRQAGWEAPQNQIFLSVLMFLRKSIKNTTFSTDLWLMRRRRERRGRKSHDHPLLAGCSRPPASPTCGGKRWRWCDSRHRRVGVSPRQRKTNPGSPSGCGTGRCPLVWLGSGGCRCSHAPLVRSHKSVVLSSVPSISLAALHIHRRQTTGRIRSGRVRAPSPAGS